MDAHEKLTLTHINKISFFQKVIRNLTIGKEVSQKEYVYILACAIIFLRHYTLDKRCTSYAEFAYYIILKYSVATKDYKPLYDFSANFGFYPIAKILLDNQILQSTNLLDCCLNIELERFKNGSYIETFHQHTERTNLLADKANEKSYIAPTSFGKSSVIIECIEKYASNNRMVIVVPTKSLLMQTYRMVRDANLKRKIIIHDEMYQGEQSFIAIFTQERSLRLLSKTNVHFDVIFIDEAHNMLKDDARSILLSRLINKNRKLNPQQKVIYLSPLIDNVNSLKTSQDQTINTHKIPFNIKEPEIFEYKRNNEIFKYNRFVGAHYVIGKATNIYAYIIDSATKKNFLYNYRPVSIERLAKDLSNFVAAIEITAKVKELIKILKEEVHEKFYIVDYIQHGIIYLHGKLPDLIKEYLESKFRDIPEIKYIIANSVILEGMNLPIDNLYILNTYGLYGKELTNLIGRVNRLNTIFVHTGNNLDKLLPRVHFVNSDKYNRKDSNMTAKIELLRSRTFTDLIENPTLSEFDFDKLKHPKDKKEHAKLECEKIQKNEASLDTIPKNDKEKLHHYLLETGISNFYKDVVKLTDHLYSKIAYIPSRADWSKLTMMEKIADLFIQEINYINDFEFSRLSIPEARSYYEFHITVSQKKSLKENIIYMFKFFKKRAATNISKMYFGKTYGDVTRDVNPSPSDAKVYIDLAKKNDTELINLAIVKLKIEDDFVSFKLNKFIVMLHDYNLIRIDEYNTYIYGTTDQKKIDLTKIGLTLSLISRLEKDNQLQYLFFDESNNLKASIEFDTYKLMANDLYRFEIERFLN